MNSALANICAYIEKNKKCKLPWSFVEIEEAKQNLLEFIAEDDN